MQNKLLEDLLLIACSTNTDILQRRDAVKNLVLLIEKHSKGADRELVYRELLRADLVDMRLDPRDKSEIVAALCVQLAEEPTTNGIVMELLWALGKTDGPPALRAIHAVVKYILKKETDDQEIWQGILSIEHLSYSVADAELSPLLPALEVLQARVLASGGVDSKKAIKYLIAILSGRGLWVA